MSSLQDVQTAQPMLRSAHQAQVDFDERAVVSDQEPATRTPSTHTPPHILHSTITAQDVTSDFKRAASVLKNGFLIKDEAFSLVEAVAALEIGDPKMDSGFLEESNSPEATYDCARSLSAGEVLWLMDELMCYEVAWLTGYPLSQTLFTSCYIDCLLWPEPKVLGDAKFTTIPALEEADPLVHKVFRSYCLALLKCCDLVHTMITSQQYYEEEDFAGQLFHRQLLHFAAVEDVQELILSAHEWIQMTSIIEEVKVAIRERLLSRQRILQLLEDNSQLRPSEHLHIESLIKQLSDLRRTAPYGIPVPTSFSLKVQHTLASSIPPRPMVKIEAREALDYFVNLCLNSAEVLEVFEAEGSTDLLTAYWLFMDRKPQPSIYIRALLQSFLEQNEKVLGRYSDRDFIFDDLQRFVMPSSPFLHRSNDFVEVPSDARFQLTQQLDVFVSRTKSSFLHLYRTACFNRCRIRRTLCHSVIEWDQLQAEAEEIDERISTLTNELPVSFPAGGTPTYSYALSSWTYHHKLCQMESLVQMGFELSIYAPEELPSMYWYLSHLCSIHLSHLDRISFFVERSTPKRGKSMPTSIRGDPEPDTATKASLRFLFRLFTKLKATEAMASSLHLVYTVLARRGQLCKSRQPYASERLRYELRMRPFLHLAIPQPPDFEDFQILVSVHQMADQDLLREAQRAISQAKLAWEDISRRTWNSQPALGERPEGPSAAISNSRRRPVASCIGEQWTGEMKNVIKACIGTSIAVAKLTKDMDHNNQVEIPMPGDRDYWHKHWLVPRIRS